MTLSNVAARAAQTTAADRGLTLPSGHSLVTMPDEGQDAFLTKKYDVGAYQDAFASMGLNPTEAWIAATVNYAGSERWISYSRNNNSYSSAGLGTRTAILGAIERLAGKGLIDNLPQIPHSPRPQKRTAQSIMRATTKMHELFRTVVGNNRLPLIRPDPSIILRDRHTKESMLFLPSKEILEMERNVHACNEAIMSADLPLGAEACMRRIFSGRWDAGGRFYAEGASWQNMKSQARKEITISGEPPVEIDFKAIHPSMLYIMSDLSVPSDCYAVPGWEKERDLVKYGLLILINAKSKKEALGAMQDKMLPGDREKENIRGDAIRIISDIERHHAPISHYFFRDFGITLQNFDSKIADCVLQILLNKGIVALPVHDSFLVARSHGRDLESAMLEAAAQCGFGDLRVEWKWT